MKIIKNHLDKIILLFGVLAIGLVAFFYYQDLPVKRDPDEGTTMEEYLEKAGTNLSQTQIRYIAIVEVENEEYIGGLYDTVEECETAIDGFKDNQMEWGDRDLLEKTSFECREQPLIGTNEQIAAIEATFPGMFETSPPMGSDEIETDATPMPARTPIPTHTVTPKGKIKWEIVIYHRETGEPMVSNQKFDTLEDCNSKKDEFLSGYLAETGQQNYIDDYRGFGCEEMWWDAD